jgi:hypothetical protein
VPVPAGGFGAFGWLVLGGLLLAVLAVGVVLYWTSERPPPKPRAAAATPVPAAEEGPRPDEQPPPVLWRQAEQLAAAGRFREAVRAVYLAVLSRLHQQRLLRYERTRTNGEYVREVRLAQQAPPALHAAFARLTAQFEGRWYGDAGCAAGDYADCRRLAEEVQTLARG